MAIPVEADDGGQDQYQPPLQDKQAQYDATPAELDSKRADMQVEANGAIEDMAAPPPADDRAALKAEHDAILEDISSSLATPTVPLLGEVNKLAGNEHLADIPEPPAQQRGRYYVPPQERTPENRDERRSEADRILNEMRSSVLKDDFPTYTSPEFTESYENRIEENKALDIKHTENNFRTGNRSSDAALLSLLTAHNEAIIDLSREFERLRTRLEANRL